jgi:hypothetical protein
VNNINMNLNIDMNPGHGHGHEHRARACAQAWAWTRAQSRHRQGHGHSLDHIRCLPPCLCVGIHVLLRVTSMSLFLFKFVCKFCQAYFNRLLRQQITFNAYSLPENQQITFEVILWYTDNFSTDNLRMVSNG